MRNFLILFLLLNTVTVWGQSLLDGTEDVVKQVELLNLKNQDDKSLEILNQALKNPANGPDDLIYLNTFKKPSRRYRDRATGQNQ